MHQSILYTVPQAAQMLQVSRSTLYRLIASGELETLSVRGTRRIRPAAIERYVDNLQRKQRERQVRFA